MGVHDRDYYREDDDPTPRLGAPTVLVSLIIVNAVLFALNFLLTNDSDAITDAMALHSDAVLRPWRLYGLVTYGFAHDPGNIFHILFNMYILYMFGREVQSRLGQGVFLGFYLSAIVFAGAVWLAWYALQGDYGASAIGASGAVVATAVAYCTYWPHRQLSFFGLITFPCWVYASILVGLDLLNALADRGGDPMHRIAWQAHLGGAAFGFLFAWFSPQILPALQQATSFSPRRWWQKRKLRIYHEAQEQAERDFEKLEREADALFAKVHEFGEESLTARERKTLEDYSRHIRQRRR